MTPDQLEIVYERSAITLNTIAKDKRALFLAKRALLWAQQIGDAEKLPGLIDAAAQNLDA